MKETFIVRTEWFDAIQDLEPLERVVLYDNLFHFHMGNENLINLNNLSVKLVWKLIRLNLIRNIENYDNRRITSSENGKLGGRPKKEVENNLINLIKPNEKPIEIEKPIESLSVSVSVSDSVSVKEKKAEVDYPFSEKFKQKWIEWKNYKKTEHKFNFKSAQSEQAAINEIIEKSYNNEPAAILIIHQSIANGWKGLFELKKQTITNAGNLNHVGRTLEFDQP